MGENTEKITVIILMVTFRNFSEPDPKTVSDEEEQWLQPYRIPMKIYEVNEKTSPSQMEEIRAGIKALPKPVYIHGFFTHDKEIVLFEALYRKSIK